MPADSSAPYDQLADESGPAWSAFKAYRDAGVKRTVDGVYRGLMGHGGGGKGPSAPRAWRRWSKEHRWQERARAWDQHQEKIAQSSTEKVIAEQAAAEQRRRARHLEREEVILDSVFETLQKMSAVSLFRRKTVDEVDPATGKPLKVTIFEPAKWTMDTFVSMAAMFQRGGRLNARMPVSFEPEPATSAVKRRIVVKVRPIVTKPVVVPATSPAPAPAAMPPATETNQV